MFHLISALSKLLPAARAHCDTEGGPVVTDGRRSLSDGDLDHALKWIPADAEPELRDVFADAIAVRAMAAQAQRVADRLFLETLVRLHRAGEGVAFTGIERGAVTLPPEVVAADEALVSGDIVPLRELVPPERRDELGRRFAAARALRGYDLSDVAAGRAYVAAYVDFVHYAEGHEHAHEHAAHEHAHDHAGHDADAHPEPAHAS
ncbi:hypothetical protein G7070_12555 [Propioniciclava coleopterorum]|uniref:Uncharacterized protein n=1 Tax=Propioniciclava coleopterorum TaxID=2714937 RepID=A0A6G7Y802_9ACTN|nr:DUF6448 family protein [Propioniciclava coleopterorum]QIK72945.1 hypothetical protein G7070_12555 [Propioniciclava coleopterorum]